MGCGSSSGSSGRIRMKKTKLAGVDEFFDDAQGLIDEIYEVKDPIEDGRADLLDSTDLDKVECANTHHATVGIVFAMAATSQGSVDPASLFKVTPAEPYIEISEKSAQGKTLQAVQDLQTYLKAMLAAKDRIPALTEKAQAIADKAPDMPNKLKDELGNAQDLGMMDKAKAPVNCASNVKDLAKLPALVKDLGALVKDGMLELQAASKELEESKAKLGEIGKTCKDKKVATPKDCYLECGKEIEVTPEKKKAWMARKKAGRRRGGKGKGKAKGKK